MALAFSGYSPPRISIFETFASIQLAYGPHPAAAKTGSVFRIRTGALKIIGKLFLSGPSSLRRIEKSGLLCVARISEIYALLVRNSVL